MTKPARSDGFLGSSVVFFAALFLFAAPSFAEGVNSLIEVGESQKAAQKILDQETKTYTGILGGIASGDISVGKSQDHIGKRYGQPVAVTREKEQEVWVYKPAHATHFDRKKVRLYFGSDKNISRIESPSAP